MKILKYLENKTLSIFLIIIFFLRLPPFNLIPGKDISFINTHSISRYLLIIIFIFFILKSYVKKKQISLNLDKKVIFFTIFYFVTQSLSIINTNNIYAFWEIYKHIAFGILFFFVSILILDNKKKVLRSFYFLIITIILNLFFELNIFFFQNSLAMIQELFYSKYWEVFILNLKRGRFFIDIYDFSLLPLIFVFFLNFKNKLTTFFIETLILLITFFLAIFSNFRTHLFITVFSLVGVTYILSKNKNIFIINLLGFLFTIFILSNFIRGFIRENTIERIIDPSGQEIKTVFHRFNWWQQSIEMGLSSPIFGIGINNFYEYLSPKKEINMAVFGLRNKLIEITAMHPHSILFQTFAETGFLGFFSLILLLGYFIKNDFNIFIKKNTSINLIIVSFWSLFLFALFNPPITFQYIILFWFLRTLIIKFSEYKL